MALSSAHKPQMTATAFNTAASPTRTPEKTENAKSVTNIAASNFMRVFYHNSRGHTLTAYGIPTPPFKKRCAGLPYC